MNARNVSEKLICPNFKKNELIVIHQMNFGSFIQKFLKLVTSIDFTDSFSRLFISLICSSVRYMTINLCLYRCKMQVAMKNQITIIFSNKVIFNLHLKYINHWLCSTFQLCLVPLYSFSTIELIDNHLNLKVKLAIFTFVKQVFFLIYFSFIILHNQTKN